MRGVGARLRPGLPVGLLGLPSVRVGLLIQECPQREILWAGASSIQKLVHLRICDRAIYAYFEVYRP